MTHHPFGQFQYPTSPLGVSDEYRNRLLHKKLGQRFPGIWEDPK